MIFSLLFFVLHVYHGVPTHWVNFILLFFVSLGVLKLICHNTFVGLNEASAGHSQQLQKVANFFILVS